APVALLRLRKVSQPQGDRTLGASQLGLDPVVRPALEAQLPRLGPEVVLRARALGPGRRLLSLHQLPDEVSAVDLQLVADLSKAVARPPQRHCLLAQALEVGVS